MQMIFDRVDKVYAEPAVSEKVKNDQVRNHKSHFRLPRSKDARTSAANHALCFLQ